MFLFTLFIDAKPPSSYINEYTVSRYDPGDHVAIYPENNRDLVTKLGERLNTDLDKVISMSSLDGLYTFGLRLFFICLIRKI